MSELTVIDVGSLRNDLHLYEASATPTERTGYIRLMQTVHTALITTMKTLREGGVVVRPEQIQDLEPFNWRLDNFFILDPLVYTGLIKKIGYTVRKDDLASYCDREKMILLKNPAQVWKTSSNKWKNDYMNRFVITTAQQARQHFFTAGVNTALAEETIHGFFDYSLFRYEQAGYAGKPPVPPGVVDYLNEAVTKLLLEETLEKQGIPYIKQQKMTDLVERFPGRFAEIVFFGSNSPETDYSILATVQKVLEKEHQKPVSAILRPDGYLQ